MQRFTLGQVYSYGFCVGDIDVLVKHGKASLGKQSGKLIVMMNMRESADFLNGLDEKRKHR